MGFSNGFIAIAIHHPRREHADALAAFLRRVRSDVQRYPGLLEFRGYRDRDSGRFVAVSRWETEEACRLALPLIFTLSEEPWDHWFERSHDVLSLSEV